MHFAQSKKFQNPRSVIGQLNVATRVTSKKGGVFDPGQFWRGSSEVKKYKQNSIGSPAKMKKRDFYRLFDTILGLP
jgi:hypothetical protein